MTLLRMLLLSFVVLHCKVFAAGYTDEQEALRHLQKQRAPLALSADGNWRIHANAANVLYRVSLSDPATVQKIALPVSPQALAISRSGLRVAFVSAWQCVGLVEFSADGKATPSLTWKPVPIPPTGQPEADCAASGDTIAMSDDGKLLATPTDVIDIDKKKVIATLGIAAASGANRAALHLKFIERDSKLVAATATLGEAWESIGLPSSLQFAVWNLADKSLQRFSSVDGSSFYYPLALFADYARSSHTLYWVDAGRIRTGKEKPMLMVQSLASCNAKPVARMPLPMWGYDNLVIDPRGRWLSATRLLTSEHGAKPVKGYAAELLVFDIGTGKQIDRQLLKRAVGGMVASADGSTLHSLTTLPVDPDTDVRASYGGEPVKISLDLEKLTSVGTQAAAWDSAACPIENELSEARKVRADPRLLKPLWSVPVESMEALANGQQPPVENAGWCNQRDTESRVVVRRDGSIWLNRYGNLANLDPQTGKISATLAVPRKEPVCHLLPHSGDGYIAYQGDTVVYRVFDKPQSRRVIDVRPGWNVTNGYFHGRALVLYWVAREGTPVRPIDDDTKLSMQVVSYDADTFKVIKTRLADAGAVEYAGDESEPARLEFYLPPCTDAAGPITSGHDWRLSHFDSVRAFSCAPRKEDIRTVFWWHMDIAPATAAARRIDDYQRRAWPGEGNLAVAQDNALLHVFDIRERREIARIATRGKVMDVHLIGSAGLVLVDTEETGQSVERKLTAYALRMAPDKK
jgi:hypothetical protein